MSPRDFGRLARRLMRCPAAPFHEAGVAEEVERICREEGLRCRRDRHGNLIVEGRRGRGGTRPLVLAAHMDHPGFEIMKTLGPGRWEARFLGGVPDRYFQRGIGLRLLPGGGPALLGNRLAHGKRFIVRALKPPADKPEFAVWALEDFALRGGRITGRACDDLIGVAAILATLIELKKSRRAGRVIGVISRAEEVGFLGALTVAASGRLPRRALVISLETSRELPPVRMGQGVIVRVGDRASVFDSAGSRFLAAVAEQPGTGRAKVPFQRALMSGGTCEGTAFQERGYQTAALCVALGNYHNCAEDGTIAAEYVSLGDAAGMAALLVAAAARMPSFGQITGRLPARLDRLLEEARRKL